jgi:ATP-dependent DNA ligase
MPEKNVDLHGSAANKHKFALLLIDVINDFDFPERDQLLKHARPDRTGEWEPVAPKTVVEVAYDHFTGGRFRHGTKLLRWRSDKGPRQCTMDQAAHREGKSLVLL